MFDVVLPFSLAAIVAGLATVGAICLVYPPLQEAQGKKDKNTFAWLLSGLGLIYISFMITIWYKYFQAYGTITFLITFLISVVPLSLVAFLRNRKHFMVSLIIFFVVLIVLAIIMVCAGLK